MEGQSESKSAQKDLKKLINDLSNAEYHQKVIEKYKDKCKKLKKQIRKNKAIYERYKFESKTLWDNERLALSNIIREHEKTITNMEELINEKERRLAQLNDERRIQCQ